MRRAVRRSTCASQRTIPSPSPLSIQSIARQERPSCTCLKWKIYEFKSPSPFDMRKLQNRTTLCLASSPPELACSCEILQLCTCGWHCRGELKRFAARIGARLLQCQPLQESLVTHRHAACHPPVHAYPSCVNMDRLYGRILMTNLNGFFCGW